MKQYIKNQCSMVCVNLNGTYLRTLPNLQYELGFYNLSIGSLGCSARFVSRGSRSWNWWAVLDRKHLRSRHKPAWYTTNRYIKVLLTLTVLLQFPFAVVMENPMASSSPPSHFPEDDGSKESNDVVPAGWATVLPVSAHVYYTPTVGFLTD